MVEQEGGWWNLYLNNRIQRDIREVRNNRVQKVVNGEIKLVGFNPKREEKSTKIQPK